MVTIRQAEQYTITAVGDSYFLDVEATVYGPTMKTRKAGGGSFKSAATEIENIYSSNDKAGDLVGKRSSGESTGYTSVPIVFS